ncbi:unnamed protein product [Rotaria sordida]|uniref:Vesicle transport protein USE1 n=1 Tax=Rotaria sordida TaxID=392033 RepID=A0A813N5V1_9BILA|nr:unnamed protein product [Rotaria sordida]CAF0726521.1 unnamed protein product [Rotaria sordida]CAF0732289.1 unnamed protein product [Rotaria sordida]CAF0792700.1 unnamed protein product [Rotaria sordida]CAF3598836.1 unnamed protein product [Rotaria sordida]
MSAIISLSNLTTEKTFRRLLLSTEKLSEEKSIEDWKLNQFVKALTDMLNDMRKSMNRPSSKQLDEYKRRIDMLRENIDSTKLEDQTFPRQVIQQIPTDIPVKEQQTEVTTTSISSTEIEKTLSTSNKSDRQHSNRQQQHIQSEEDKQDEIATSMRITTKSLLNNAKLLHDVVKSDQKKLTEAENLIDINTAKLNIQSKRLKHNAYNVSNCWIYLMLIIVIITFIYLTLFMRMFRKRIRTITHSNIGSKSSLINLSNNQTTINITNVTTTTKSTDYISLLLNYANENHTDL